jgi:predicted ATPase/class 3 adenylate cyclase
MRREFPTGTVTFLFTDVEGSTRLLHELGTESYAEALAEHRRVIRDACTRYRGVEVDTQGDAFFLAFPTAPGALAAAGEMTAALTYRQIQVRIGLHTGTPLLTEEGYVGGDVHRAARIAASGHGGQVLVSSSTAPLVEDELTDLGEHRFKDLGAPERIYQLGVGEFPALKSLYRTNLPVPATPFLGRERELVEVVGLLDGTRLLTLTGPGGMGKTRLASQAAGVASDRYPDGVWWIPLAPLRDPALVLETAAQVVGSKSGLAESVADKAMLLLFDNFEQVVEAAADLASLLASCPNLDLLVTSREPLHVTGEQEYQVPPLAHEEGVSFFLARARAVEPDFQADEAVPEVCRRLDDLPLALELAAARVKALSSTQILERLEQRLPLLTGGARDLPERQRTLRATIEWSHELLTPEEQQLFSRLAVFVGGCTLEAAEEVAEAELDTLHSLVDKSLVRHTGDRYWMLETIREYAGERLRASGDLEVTERRHAQHFLALAVSANLSLGTPGEQRFDLAISEEGNLRAALGWALAHDETEFGLELAVALDDFWYTNHPQEGARWFASLLGVEASAPTALLLRASMGYGNACRAFDTDGATALYRDALALARELGDERAVAMMFLELAMLAFEDGDYAESERLIDEGRAANERAGSPAVEVMRLETLGRLAAYRDGDIGLARELVGQALTLARAAGLAFWEAEEASELAGYERAAGRLDIAEMHARDSLERSRQIRHRKGVIGAFATLATIARTAGDVERAGLLWGALEAEERRAPITWAMDREAWEARVSADAGPEFERARRAGSVLSLDEAVTLALDSVE